MRSVSKLKDFVYDEADEYPSFELDDVREVGDGDNSVVLRVLVEDGETEADQVGFEVTRPNIDQGREMFNRSVLSGLRELRDLYRDDRSNDRDRRSEQDEDVTEEETTQSEPTEAQSETPSGDSSGQDTQLGPVGVSLSIDDDDREFLVTEMQSAISEIEDEVASDTDIDRIESRLDEIDQRLTDLEEALSMIGK